MHEGDGLQVARAVGLNTHQQVPRSDFTRQDPKFWFRPSTRDTYDHITMSANSGPHKTLNG